MRRFVSLICCLACVYVTSVTRSAERPHCAFADESFVTYFTIASAVTEYYARHHVWPTTTQQLRAEILHSIATSAPIAAKPTTRDVDDLFARFRHIRLIPKDRSLILDVRYRAEGKTYTRRILIPPGKTSDEMLPASVEVK